MVHIRPIQAARAFLFTYEREVSVRLLTASCQQLAEGIFARRLAVFLEAKVVGGSERSGEDVFGCGAETDVGHAHTAPTSCDGKKKVGLVGEEGLLQLGCEHEVAIALLFGSKSGEDVATDAKVG